MNLSRRDLLKLGAGAALTCAAGTGAVQQAAANERRKLPIGMQLWPVSQQCQADLPAVLEAASEMGFDNIEMAHNYYNHDAETWRKLLDNNGLKCCGMHLLLPMIEGDAFQETVDIHKVIGTPYLIVATLPKTYRQSKAAVAEMGAFFNETAERLGAHGMKLGFHCHGGDFEKVEGSAPWELFGESTSDDVLLQMDVGNCLGGNADPIAMLKKFPGRATTVHIKDRGENSGAVFGEGVVDWEEVFTFCESKGGTEYYVLEESKGPRAVDTYRRALKNFRKMGK